MNAKIRAKLASSSPSILRAARPSRSRRVNLSFDPSTELVSVALPSRLLYSLKRFKGAMSSPFLAKPVATALLHANQILKRQSNGHIGLLIWDAFRTKECQTSIWDDYAQELCKREPSLDQKEVHARVAQFVTPYWGVFRHGTGGAVDVTLIDDNREMPMGTKYDHFGPEAALAYFQSNPPKTPAEMEWAANRDMLRNAMEEAGFVGLEKEWWHYEFGTQGWADVRGQTAFLRENLQPPTFESCPALPLPTQRRMPTFESGVAQAFHTPEQRDLALAGKIPAFYYARTRTRSRDQLEHKIAATFPGTQSLVTGSGLNACLAAMRALVPLGGHIVLSDTTYYEVALRLLREGRLRHWTIHPVDMENHAALSTVISSLEGEDFVVWLDQPSNWWLTTHDIRSISTVAHQLGGIVVVDTSVQPLAPVLEQGADVALFSLSKYPSNGVAMGGALLTRDPEIHVMLKTQVAHDAVALSSEASASIESQWLSLEDRITELSRKARAILRFLNEHGRFLDIKSVRVPTPSLLGTANIGGQITLELHDARSGDNAEQIVAHNFHRDDFALGLLTTFGANQTTFEHFHARGHANDEVVGRYVRKIPSGWCRLGLGNESLPKLKASLSLALEDIRHHLT